MPNQMWLSATLSITFLQLARWLFSRRGGKKENKAFARSDITPPQKINNNKNYTCRQTVVFEDLTENQFVWVKTEWVPEHADRNEVHVTVRAFGLESAGAVKVPFGNI